MFLSILLTGWVVGGHQGGDRGGGYGRGSCLGKMSVSSDLCYFPGACK